MYKLINNFNSWLGLMILFGLTKIFGYKPNNTTHIRLADIIASIITAILVLVAGYYLLIFLFYLIGFLILSNVHIM